MEIILFPRPNPGPPVKLVALRPLCGDYGTVTEGQIFEAPEMYALSLQERGLAKLHREPARVQDFLPRLAKAICGVPENKMMPPAQTEIVEPLSAPVAAQELARRRKKA